MDRVDAHRSELRALMLEGFTAERANTGRAFSDIHKEFADVRKEMVGLAR